jgi:TIR domain
VCTAIFDFFQSSREDALGEISRPLKSVHKHISTLISHSAVNNDEAQRYQKILQDGDFSAFQYGDSLLPGHPIANVLREKISKCHFFMLVISQHSLNSPWAQRELGLALSLQNERRSYRPIVIPLHAEKAAWRRTKSRSTLFPVRNFETGEPVQPFSLDVRGWDKYCSPLADSDLSLSSSPWIRGAPQSWFSVLICRISARNSISIRWRPPRWFDFRRQ